MHSDGTVSLPRSVKWRSKIWTFFRQLVQLHFMGPLLHVQELISSYKLIRIRNVLST